MAGLIGSGQLYRKRALEGFSAVANLEAKTEAAQDSLDMQQKANEMQLYGMGAGIGGAVGVKKAMAAGAKQATGGGFVSSTGGAAGMSQSANAGAAASEAVRNTAANVKGIMSPGAGLAKGANANAVVGGIKVPGAGVVGGTKIGAAGAAGSGAAGAGGAAASTTGAAAGTTGAAAGTTGAATGAAAGSSGAMATLGTIAAPIAIGIGAAFLLNKLFG